MVPSIGVAQRPADAVRYEMPASISEIPIVRARSSVGSRGINGHVTPDFASFAPLFEQVDDDSDPGLSLAATGNTMGGSEGGGRVGAADAVNPAAPVLQLQFQNVFTPDSYESRVNREQRWQRNSVPFLCS